MGVNLRLNGVTREEKQGQKIGLLLLKTEITGDRFDKCASRSVLDRRVEVYLVKFSFPHTL